MRALLRLTVGTPAACLVTAGAVATIVFVAAGYGSPLIAAALMAGAWGLAFWGVFFVAMVVGHAAGVLRLERPEPEAAHVDQ